jgi:hypothetical protein
MRLIAEAVETARELAMLRLPATIEGRHFLSSQAEKITLPLRAPSSFDT